MSFKIVKKPIWNKLLKEMATMNGKHVKVGVLASQGGNASHEGSELTLLELMIIHEFGTDDGKIDAREPLQTGIRDNMEEIKKLQIQLTRNIVLGKLTTKKALQILGLKVAAMIRKRVKNDTELTPGLAQSTIDKKGSSRPLVDEGTLMNAVHYEVSS